MENLAKFNIYAIAKPKGPSDLLAMLREFRAEAARLQKHLDNVTEACEKNQREAA